MTLVNDTYFFSNSEITTFTGCPRKWWLAWFRGLTPRLQDVQGPRPTGTRVHLALAAHYGPRSPIFPFGRALETLEVAQKEDLLLLEFHYQDDENLDLRRKKLFSDFDLEKIMVEGYLEWIQETGIDADLEIVGVEQYLEADFPMHLPHDPQPVKLIGKVDARVRSRITGRRKYIDHKTVQSVRDPLLKLNRQMKHYHLLEELTTAKDEQRCDGALYNMLRRVKRTAKATPPFYARLPIDHNKYEIAGYRNEIYGTIASIIEKHAYFRKFEGVELRPAQHQVAVPARPSRECGWCPFMKVCHMFDDGSRVEDALVDLYQVQDPLSYYGAREKGAEIED